MNKASNQGILTIHIVTKYIKKPEWNKQLSNFNKLHKIKLGLLAHMQKPIYWHWAVVKESAALTSGARQGALGANTRKKKKAPSWVVSLVTLNGKVNEGIYLGMIS